ncbi:low temperature requirement protein A [Streptomyces sp. 6N223]|uniref:low temperature requirement protein A n=1 Tax=Streptomyces sp. 6N223 TaxID=3457412 RepID=UPI003FD14234
MARDAHVPFALRRPMYARDSGEEHRAATPLELFFDLCFVVAVAQVAAQLHHYLSDGHEATAIGSYIAVFFAIWWAWMNFSWFASAYDVDDVPYRIAALVTITGALVLAAGVPRAFSDDDFAIAVIGYMIMRLALISLWLRAARADVERRATARRYALGLAVVQSLWVAWLAVPSSWQMPVFALFALLDLAVPVWAERAGATPWHPRHIAERYGLFTIIVLGESVLSATFAVQQAVDADEVSGELFVVAGGGLLTVFAMWWLYFSKPAHAFLSESGRTAFLWGYGHWIVFASAAAVGAGLAVNVDHVTHHAHTTATAASAAFTVPVAVFLLVLWFLQVRPHHTGPLHALLFPAAALLVLLATFAGDAASVLVAGVVMAALVGCGTWLARAGAGAGAGAGTGAGTDVRDDVS